MAKPKPSRPGPRPIELAADRRKQARTVPDPVPASTTHASTTHESATHASTTRFRDALQRLSAGPMVRLATLPTALLPTILLALLLFGMLFPANWAGFALVVVGLLLTWWTALSWPATSIAGRTVRVLVNCSLLALGIARIAGLLG